MTTLDTPKTPDQLIATMLRSTIEADLLVSEYINDAPLRQAEQQACVNGLVAAAAMEMLQRFAPDAAESLAHQLDLILTAGDIAGPAWRTAQGLNLNPDQWIAEFHERAARRRQKAATSA